MDQIKYLVVHHSGSPLNTTLERIREWHLAKGWDDTGYHYVIEESGLLRAGRTMPKQGAHCPPHNSHSIGVCISGDNTLASRVWTLEQWNTLRFLVSSVRVLWPKIEVVGHRDIGSTDTMCPGVNIKEYIL